MLRDGQWDEAWKDSLWRYKSQKPREIEGREEADGPMAVTDAMADTSSSACCEFS